MSLSTATAAQLAQVADFTRLMRSIVISMAVLENHIDAALLAWNANIIGIMGAPGNILINDATGLAGAVELTDTQVTNLVGLITSYQSTFGTSQNRQAMTLAVGPTNMIG